MMVQLKKQPQPHKEEVYVSNTNRHHEQNEGQPPLKKRKCGWTVSEQHHTQKKQRKHPQQQVVQRVRFHSQIQVRYFSAREESNDQDTENNNDKTEQHFNNNVSYSRQELSRFRGSAYAVARAMSRADKDKSLIGSYREGVCQLHQVCAASSSSSCCGLHATCKDDSSAGEEDAVTTSDKDAADTNGKNVLHNPLSSSSGSLSLADQLVDKLKDVLQRLDQQHLHCNSKMHSSSILFLGLERHAARDLHQARSVQREEMLQEIRLLQQQQQCTKTTFGLAEAIRVKCEAISRPSRLYALRMARLYT